MNAMIELTSTITRAKIFLSLATLLAAIITKDKTSESGRGSILSWPAGLQIRVSENPTTILFLLAGSPGVTYLNDGHPRAFFGSEPANEVEPEIGPNGNVVTKLDALMAWWPNNTPAATTNASGPAANEPAVAI